MAKVFYMPPPSIQAVWNASDESEEFKEDVSVFKFLLDSDGSALAKYAICKDLSAQRTALTGLRRGWMSVACISEGFAPASTREIITTQPGVAERQPDGSWKVKELARINFEG